MIPYETAKEKAFACGYVPDGYFGDKAIADFYFHPENGHTYCVAKCGFFDSGLPPAIDEAEALWLLEHHPLARNITTHRIGNCVKCDTAASLINGLCQNCRNGKDGL
jgi:hypothetical protein